MRGERGYGRWDLMLTFQGGCYTTDAMLFHRNTHKTGNNAIEMSQAFQDIAWFECFRYLNLLEDAFNVIQNWETDATQFYSMVLISC